MITFASKTSAFIGALALTLALTLAAVIPAQAQSPDAHTVTADRCGGHGHGGYGGGHGGYGGHRGW